MRWLSRCGLLGFVLALSCTGPTDRPPPMAMGLRLANLQWSDIDGDLHLRIFARGDLRCDEARGLVLGPDNMPSDLMGVGGRRVPPHERCEGTAWATRLREQNGGEAQPIDVCFPVNMARPVDVPPGNYIVLIEGPGTQMDPSSGAPVRYLRASGCTERTAMSGMNADVPITLIEQSFMMNIGMCGNGRRDPNEQCDEGMGNNRPGGTCNELCRFPEIVANGSGMVTGRRRNPAVAWAPMQPMAVAFTDSTDAFVHSFEANGRPGALTMDFPLDISPRDQQSNVALAAGPAGYIAAWRTLERPGGGDVEALAFPNFNPPQPLAMGVYVNPTSTGATGMRLSPAVAVSGGRAGFAFVDNMGGSVRVATTNGSNPLAAPMMDAPVVPAGSMGNTNVSSVRIAAVSGGFVVVWASDNIYAVRTDANGAAMGNVVQANMEAADAQSEPAIAANGGVVAIAWRDQRPDPMDMQPATVRFRLFSEALAPSTGDLTAPTTIAGDQSSPTVAISNSGRVLVAWQHSDGHIRGRFFRADNGAPVFNGFNVTPGDFQISAGADEMDRGTGPRFAPAAAFGGDNLFVVVWEDRPSDASAEIRMRVFLAPM